MSQGPYQSPHAYGSGQMLGGFPQRSGAVTAAAVLSFVFGGLHVLCGGLMGFVAAALASGEEQFRRDFKEGFGQQPPDNMSWDEFFEFMTWVLGVFVVVALIVGILSIIAGIGVIKRSNWGRVLALIVAVLAILMGVLAGIGAVQQPDAVIWAITLIYFAYGVVLFILLLSGGAAADFRASQLAAMGLPYGGNPYAGNPYGGTGWNNPQGPGGPGQPPYNR